MVTYILGALANKIGITRIAEVDADPGELQHIHTVEPVDEHDPADCGYDFTSGDGGLFADLCPHCAALHADQPWIQRCGVRETQ